MYYHFSIPDSAHDSGYVTIIVEAHSESDAKAEIRKELTLRSRRDLIPKIKLLNGLGTKKLTPRIIYDDIQS
jgi:hypothetical protein